MFPIRYSKRACEDRKKIDEFLSTAKVGHLGLSDGEYPYVLPLNFCWHNGSIYFHGADAGRKIEVIHKNPNVCFTVCEEYGTIADPVPARTDTGYMSVMLFGRIERVEDSREMTEALQAMLDKHVPGYYGQPLSEQHVSRYRSSMGSAVAVFRIIPETLTAKDNPLPEEKRFYPGRTVYMDN
ncbi:pyridoxamine 5'-phosphate oxidase family protein [Brevibacillus sp. H7]|uniref:pyridoxamine 5'-phosphate oxidase family protein n=1 Tax=Brevibacillus sp. H7 TaxID=3349138 RepID=UPI00382FF3AD